MKAIAVIPARWESTRLKGKVLADISGKPMIQHVWERAKEASLIEDVVVAVDHPKVMKACEKFGANVVMTSPDHNSGSDRIAEVLGKIDADIAVNVQGDEPLLYPSMVDQLAEVYTLEPDVKMATLIKRIEQPEDVNDPNVVKVVTDCKGYALYFSRNPIPHLRDVEKNEIMTYDLASRYYKHIGIYSYRKDFLLKFSSLPKSSLENDEKLEQLRVLEHGYKIKTLETRYETVSVDAEEDLEKVRVIMRRTEEIA